MGQEANGIKATAPDPLRSPLNRDPLPPLRHVQHQLPQLCHVGPELPRTLELGPLALSVSKASAAHTEKVEAEDRTGSVHIWSNTAIKQ